MNTFRIVYSKIQKLIDFSGIENFKKWIFGDHSKEAKQIKCCVVKEKSKSAISISDYVPGISSIGTWSEIGMMLGAVDRWLTAPGWGAACACKGAHVLSSIQVAFSSVATAGGFWLTTPRHASQSITGQPLTALDEQTSKRTCLQRYTNKKAITALGLPPLTICHLSTPAHGKNLWLLSHEMERVTHIPISCRPVELRNATSEGDTLKKYTHIKKICCF